ncbi:MAG: AAA family ATPase [Paeniclostridium sordellii]|nr:AAA family ATPase [Paeniclostridium sordellii]
MELLYMYVDNYVNSVKNQEFKLSNKFNVEYKEDTISIRRNKDYIDNFYGNTISEITAFVGKNGSGKTTILDLIGLDGKSRVESSEYNYNEKIYYKDNYFMIYHVDEDIFYIEGLGNFNIKNIDKFNDKIRNNSSEIYEWNVKHFFSFFIKKNGNKFIIEEEEDIKTHKELARIFYINDTFGSRIKEQIQYKAISGIDFVKRENKSQFNLIDWYSMFIKLCNDDYLTSKKIQIYFKKYNYRHNFDTAVYIEPKIKDMESRHLGKHAIVIEETIEDFFRYFNNNIIEHMLHVYSEEQRNFGKYKIIKFIRGVSENNIEKYHLRIFEYFEPILKSMKDIYSKYFYLIKNLFFSMVKIKNHIIPSIDSFDLEIDNNYNEDIWHFFYNYEELKKFVDDNKNSYEHIINPIQVENIRMSKGEKKLITILSQIRGEALSYISSCQLEDLMTKKDIIIVVDEIEESMHPEWSRNLINTIIKLLDYYKVDYYENDLLAEYNIHKFINVQLIISTHSPFILSDLNKQSIIYLEKVNEYILQRDSIYHDSTFAQNIHTIMSDNFFMTSTIGEYSKKKIDKVIKILNSDDYKDDICRIKIKNIINSIGEPILKSKLEQMYNDKFKIDNSDIKKLKDIAIILEKHRIDDKGELMNLLSEAIKNIEKSKAKGR